MKARRSKQPKEHPSPARPAFPRWIVTTGVAVGIAFLILAIVRFVPLPEEQRQQVEAPPTPVRLDFDASSPPATIASDNYVGSNQCRDCHTHEHDTWYGSYHRTMTQVASPQSILGDFRDVTLKRGEQTYRLKNDGEHFWAEIDNPHPNSAEAFRSRSKHPVVLCTGSHHMQVYWVLSGHGRELIDLPFVWLTKEKRWIPRESSFLVPPLPPDVEPSSIWNSSCMTCHTTHPDKALNPPDSPNRPQTTVAEFGISCEACHGPGQAHIESHRLHEKNPNVEVVSLVDPSKLPHDRVSQVCGQCHMAWHRETPGSDLALRPGDDLGRVRQSVMNPSQFWPDGMVRIVGREWNGLKASPCFLKGELTCLSCHEMHPANESQAISDWNEDQLKPGFRGDIACTQCHTKYEDESILISHTHHAANSPGSRCYNCHAPNTTYGLLKATISHQITSPTAAETVRTGRPNACNLCHLDRSLQWTDKNLAQWYRRPLTVPYEFKSDLAMSVTMALQGDAAQRALIAWHFGWEPARQASKDDWMVPYLAILMTDPYPAVRFIAQQSLLSIGGYQDIEYDTEMDRNALMKAAATITSRWKSRFIPYTRPELLLVPDRIWDWETVDSLLKQRDQTPVFLHE